MKHYHFRRSTVGLVATIVSAVLLGCYAQGTEGTLLLYNGARRSADSVATIVVAIRPNFYLVQQSGDKIELRDTLEIEPGPTTMMLGPSSRFPGRRYYGNVSYHTRAQRISRGYSDPKYTATSSRCWELTFEAQAGHVYDLHWDTAASHDVELVLSDRAFPWRTIRSMSDQVCH